MYEWECVRCELLGYLWSDIFYTYHNTSLFGLIDIVTTLTVVFTDCCCYIAESRDQKSRHQTLLRIQRTGAHQYRDCLSHDRVDGTIHIKPNDTELELPEVIE